MTTRENNGKTSRLRMRLELEDGPQRIATIAGIANTYAITQDLGRTAQEFGAERRTLERLIQEHPDLMRALGAVRSTFSR